MSILPSSLIRRSHENAFHSQPSPPSSEAPSTSSSSPSKIPVIVNQQAQKLAKRQKTEKFTTTDVFKALHIYLDDYSCDDQSSFKKIAQDFKTTKTDLYNWILQNGPTVREDLASYDGHNRRDKYLVESMRELLYCLPLASLKEKPLHPETILAYLRRLLLEGYQPTGVVVELLRKKNFLYNILNIPLSDLQRQAVLFVAHDVKEIQELFSETLDRVYLEALRHSEVMNQVQILESNFYEETTRSFKRSEPSYWSNILKIECSSWRDVIEGLNRMIQNPLPEDFDSLQTEERRVRAVSCELSALQSLLSLEENPLRNHLFFIVRSDPLYPECRAKFPRLFDRLGKCRSELPLSTYLHQLSSRLEECQNKKFSMLPPRPRTAFDDFFFNYDRLIFDTAIELLYDCVRNSLDDRSTWPKDLEQVFRKALIQSSFEDPKDNSWDQIEDDPEMKKQFIYLLSSEYVGKDPIEWMQNKILQLGNDSLEALLDAFRSVSPQERSTVLYDFLSSNEKLPLDLISFKAWCQF